jgi:hypothetical protein
VQASRDAPCALVAVSCCSTSIAQPVPLWNSSWRPASCIRSAPVNPALSGYAHERSQEMGRQRRAAPSAPHMRRLRLERARGMVVRAREGERCSGVVPRGRCWHPAGRAPCRGSLPAARTHWRAPPCACPACLLCAASCGCPSPATLERRFFVAPSPQLLPVPLHPGPADTQALELPHPRNGASIMAEEGAFAYLFSRRIALCHRSAIWLEPGEVIRAQLHVHVAQPLGTSAYHLVVILLVELCPLC